MREQRPGVVVEPDGVGEAGGLGDQLAEPADALGAVVEPPRRSEPQRRVVAGERGQLPAVGALVERVDDDGQRRLVAEPVEQRLERAHVVHRLGDVGALVGPEAGGQRGVVAAPRAGVELQHEPVVEAHGRHLDQHLAPEPLGVARLGPARAHPAEERLGLGARQVGGGGGRVAVVAGGGAGGDERGSAAAQRGEVAGPRGGVLAGHLRPAGRGWRRSRAGRGRRRRRGGTWAPPAPAIHWPGCWRGHRGRRGRRRWWRGTRCRSGRRARGGGSRRRRGDRRGGRTPRRRSRRRAAR